MSSSLAFRLPVSVSEIVKDQLLIGNITAASSPDVLLKLGITHLVSVCPELPSTGEKHLAIAVDDSEYEDLLIHLPKACEFIQSALATGGKVLVHCIMGISRSATVLAAYLMKSRRLSSTEALELIRAQRPQVQPNYGFLRQLDAFAECEYNPSTTHPAYIAWKQKQSRHVTRFLTQLFDTISIIPDKLFLSSEFPDDEQQINCLLSELSITHLLTVAPSDIPFVPTSVTLKHIDIRSTSPDDLLVALPGMCDFIQQALDARGRVLVHSETENRACIAICAYLMSSQQILMRDAVDVVENALPLFSPSPNVTSHLQVYEACSYHPTAEHPLVKEWCKSIPQHYTLPTSAWTPTPTSTPRPSFSASASPAVPTSTTFRSSLRPVAPISTKEAGDLNATMASLLSETGIDMAAFGKTMAHIQVQKTGVVEA